MKKKMSTEKFAKLLIWLLRIARILAIVGILIFLYLAGRLTWAFLASGPDALSGYVNIENIDLPIVARNIKELTGFQFLGMLASFILELISLIIVYRILKQLQVGIDWQRKDAYNHNSLPLMRSILHSQVTLLVLSVVGLIATIFYGNLNIEISQVIFQVGMLAVTFLAVEALEHS